MVDLLLLVLIVHHCEAALMPSAVPPRQLRWAHAAFAV